MKVNTSKSGWQKVRKLLNDLHLWMGLASGLILFVVCLSGTVYTFSSDIQEWLEPGKYKLASEQKTRLLTAETLMAKVMDSLQDGRITAVTIPADSLRTWQVTVMKTTEKTTKSAGAPRPDRGTTYFVNPYSGEVLGTTEGAGYGFFMFMFKLHRWLLLDMEIGRPIVGWATVIFSLLVISGLIIWIPQKARMWRQGLKVKFSANWKRVNHDLHNTLGFYSSFLLLIMSLTGLTWSFEWYRDGFHKVLGTYKPRGASREESLKSVLPAEGQAIKPTVAAYLEQVNAQLPYAGISRIAFAGSPDGIVTVTKNKTGFFAPAAGDRIMLDQYSAAVLKTEIFSSKPVNERISGSVKALHIGNVYGSFSKILYFIACLVATSLPVTGTLIWINKLKKKKPAAATPGLSQRSIA
ncbi:PepSY-associated TM helix domain-containing protein [Flavihumibacter stibioxidans]|uniref:Sulfite reductase n=1 Tax=Flavihumibacter stibioxidans TaxID=1834163 RepID=A0ABR7M3E9_9BACT|nr:PepSY-associated TM helix domain-containing protein [Flavihumibacter stibioxidans]MBC6489374.1 sulfite reductase [Flavihumibacter stibioxidans]